MPVDTLRLSSPGKDEGDVFSECDVMMWIRHAVKRDARVIQLTGHLSLFADLNTKDFISRKLSPETDLCSPTC